MKGLRSESKEILIRRGYTIAVAESLTGGLLQDFFVQDSGASDYFSGGLTAYTVAMKVELLGVNPEKASACRGVSEEIAIEMAKGVCLKFKAAIGLATTGFAVPDSTQNIKTPIAYFALVFRDQCILSGQISENLSRNAFRIRVVKRVGEELERWILKQGEVTAQ
jgi:nicotinamide-nucleotide amidase